MSKKAPKKYKPPKKKQPVFSFVKRILRLFYKKTKIVNLGEKIQQAAIIISNHCFLRGPVIHELYLPVFHAKWGAGEMLGTYKMRYRYMRDVAFIQKKGYGKVKATIFAAVAALVSQYFYKGMKVIPTWRDSRMFKTVSDSVETLKDGTSVLIFPENSDDGYHEVLTEFYPGFVTLAESYYKKTKTDVPVYPVYHHAKTNTTFIGKPRYVQDFVKQGLSRAQIAEEFRKIVNGLYTTHILNNDANKEAAV